LGIGEICQLPVVVSGQLEIGWTLRITAGADHRVLNGVEVAEYLKTLREFLEQPSKWTR
jgi:pyruvate dehydrogenase E2 component (dihydrolipoamide acetyltransferase)